MIKKTYTRSKYSSVKTVIDGIKFDSKAEAAYYLVLKRQFETNVITKLEMQPKVYLTKAKILYKPDFLIERNGEEIYIDVKGVKTPVFNLKARLWKCYTNAVLEIVIKSGRRFIVDKVIVGSLRTK